MRETLEAAYLAGFMASGEGHNGEFPFQDRDTSPTDDPWWVERRDKDLAALRAALAEPVSPLAGCVAVWCEEAAEDVADWGGYASPYFQEKHHLQENVDKWTKRAEQCRNAAPPAPLTDEGKRDAERYHWLREQPEGVEFRDGDGVWRSDCPNTAKLDAIIDAAIERRVKGGA